MPGSSSTGSDVLRDLCRELGGELVECAAPGDAAGGHPEGSPAAPGAPAEPPPATNRGVEFCQHWMTLTLWAEPQWVARWVCELLGLVGAGVEVFEQLPHGARLFRSMWIGPGGCKLYSEPVSGEGFCSVEFPGELVKSIPSERLQSKLIDLRCRWQPTRLDLAWDHDYYAPADVYAAVVAGQVRSLAKRETLDERRQPFTGGHTVYLGSRQSERMLRVYLKNGRTRTELELKGDRARAVLLDLLSVPVDQWARRALAHLRDYCDFQTAWWDQFCDGVERAHMVLTNWAEASFEKTKVWLERQVAPALAMLQRVLGPQAVFDLAKGGRDRWGPKHRLIMVQCGVMA